MHELLALTLQFPPGHVQALDAQVAPLVEHVVRVVQVAAVPVQD